MSDSAWPDGSKWSNGSSGMSSGQSGDPGDSPDVTRIQSFSLPVQTKQGINGEGPDGVPGEPRPGQVPPESQDFATRVQRIPPVPEHVPAASRPPSAPEYQQHSGQGYQQPPPGYDQPPPGYQSYPYGQPAGYPPPQQPYGYGPPKPPNSGMAIASLVCGILWGFGVFSLVALILGIVSLNQIKQRGEGGKPMAIAGIVLGGIGLAIAIGIIIFDIILIASVHDSIPSAPTGPYPG